MPPLYDPNEIIPLADVPSVLPKRDGKEISSDAIRSWIKFGIDGVKLKTLRIGKFRFVTRTALKAFIEATSEADGD